MKPFANGRVFIMAGWLAATIVPLGRGAQPPTVPPLDPDQSYAQASELMEKVKAVIPPFHAQQGVYRLELLCGMALACEDFGKHDDANRLWDQATAQVAKPPPDSWHLAPGLLAIAKARAGDIKTAAHLIENLSCRPTTSPEGSDQWPDLDSRFMNRCRVLNRIIADQLRQNDFQGALESAALVTERLPDGNCPRNETLKWLALYLWQNKQHEFAEQAIAQVQQPWYQDETVSALISLQLSLGDAQAARASLQKITNKANYIPLLIQVAEDQAIHGHHNDAESLFGEAVALATEPRTMFGSSINIDYRISPLCRIAVAQYRVKSPAGARTLETAIKLAKESQGDVALREIAIAQAECWLLQDALKTVESIQKVNEKAEGLAGIAVAQAAAGDRAAARDLFQTAAKLASTIEQEWTRSQLLTSIIEKCAQAGELDQAFELSKTMSLAGEREQTMVAIVRECLAARDMKTAQLIRDALTLDGLRRLADASIVRFKIKEGDFKGAFAVAKIMDGPEASEVMLALIRAQIIARDYAGAVLAARTWHTDGCTYRALGDVATELARTGDLPGALALIVPGSSNVEKAFIWTGAACGLAQRQTQRQPANEIVPGLDWGWTFPRNCGPAGAR